jgi:hypothetical protein
MKKLLLILISDQQAKGDNVNFILIRQKAKRIFDKLNSLSWCLFTQKISLVLKFITSLEWIIVNNVPVSCSVSVVSVFFTLLRNQLMLDIKGPLHMKA